MAMVKLFAGAGLALGLLGLATAESMFDVMTAAGHTPNSDMKNKILEVYPGASNCYTTAQIAEAVSHRPPTIPRDDTMDAINACSRARSRTTPPPNLGASAPRTGTRADTRRPPAPPACRLPHSLVFFFPFPGPNPQPRSLSFCHKFNDGACCVPQLDDENNEFFGMYGNFGIPFDHFPAAFLSHATLTAWCAACPGWPMDGTRKPAS